MPKAAMDENHFLAASKYQVWFSGKILGMEAIAITHRVNELSDDEFWLRMCGPDPPHVLRTGFW